MKGCRIGLLLILFFHGIRIADAGVVGSESTGFIQKVRLEGSVFNEHKMPLDGVQITVSGSDKIAWTDSLGFFKVKGKVGDTVTFSCHGKKDFSYLLLRSEQNVKIILLYATVRLDPFMVLGWKPEEGRKDSAYGDQFTPHFPGGVAEMQKFMATYIRYPLIMMENSVGDVVHVTFGIDEQGKVFDPGVLKGYDLSARKEVLKLLTLMPAWKSDDPRGIIRPTRFVLPVIFKAGMPMVIKGTSPLDSYKQETLPEPLYTKVIQDSLQRMVRRTVKLEDDNVIELKAICINSSAGQRILIWVCSIPPNVDAAGYRFKKWMSIIDYPCSAMNKEIEGEVEVMFVIDKHGKAVLPKIIKGADPLLDQEVLRLVERMPKCNPATFNRRPVDTQFSLSVHFKLEKQRRLLMIKEGDVSVFGE